MVRSQTLLALCAVALLASGCSAQPSSWQLWKARFGRSYGSEIEDATREAIFHQNVERAKELSAQDPHATFDATTTPFSDLTPDEFAAKHMGYKRDNSFDRSSVSVYEPPANEVLPKAVDWRKKGAITPVKNQEQCGSCWAFSTVEEIESCWFLAGNPLPVLSPQQIVSCDNGEQGCNGGDTVQAYSYVEQAGGLDSAAAYPYTSGGGDSGQCHFKKNNITAHIKGFKYATSPNTHDENAMKSAMANKAPLSICVDASSWQTYSGGVITNNCGQQLDHCVQIAAYASGHPSAAQVDDADDAPTDDAADDNKPYSGEYWVVRNSWGADWGYGGYLYVEIGKNLCGIADEATYVLI